MTVRLNLILSLVVLLTGCGSLVPTSRKENAATKVSDQASGKAGFEFAGKVAPSFWQEVTVSNIGKGSITIKQPSEVQFNARSDINAKAGSKDWFDYSFDVSIPTGVKIILLAIGIIALLVGLKMWVKWIKTSATGKALLANDSLLARQIDKVTDKVSKATSKDEQVDLLAEKAALEKERGKNARNMPPEVKVV